MPKAAIAFTTSLFALLLMSLPAGAVMAPAAFYVFCVKYPAECRATGESVGAINLTAERRAQLEAVNRSVNKSIREAPDRGADRWTIGESGEGDCEDVALLKRHRLLAMGWPSSVLLLTVTRNHRGQGHAVLTVVTDRGDLVLDGPFVGPPQNSGNRFFTRQSQGDPRVWEDTPYR